MNTLVVALLYLRDIGNFSDESSHHVTQTLPLHTLSRKLSADYNISIDTTNDAEFFEVLLEVEGKLRLMLRGSVLN